MFDTAAEALGMTPEELFAELRAGKSPAEIAEERGVEIETVYDAVSAARSEVMQQAIEQAVEDGRLSQEQPHGPGLRPRVGRGRVPMRLALTA
jgi:hypothetical protein